MFDEYKNHDVAVYGGYLSDDEKLIQSTSGGIATALAERMLEIGGFVAGVAYSEDLYRAEYILIHDKSEIGKLKGSKYIECEKGTIYSDVKRLLDLREKVLFFWAAVCRRGVVQVPWRQAGKPFDLRIDLPRADKSQDPSGICDPSGRKVSKQTDRFLW